MKPKVYLETTIPSFLIAKASRDLIVAAHQQITQEWWECRRNQFDIFISQFVLAVAAVHAMDFLLTWNCAHIANAAIGLRVRRVCEAHGFTCPVICTPEELLEE